MSDALVVLDGGFIRRSTNQEGLFKLPVTRGLHQLVVAKIGYRPDTAAFEVTTDTPGELPDSLAATEAHFALVQSPQELRGITVEGISSPLMAQTVTAATVRNVPALAEPDIFRAVSLLPGVSTPNDTRGRLHLAGGASDEVGIRLDGHPLQDPFHLFGLLGAFNVASLERADVLMHAVPPAMSDHLSGVIDLTTRRPVAQPSGDISASVLATSASFASAGLAGIDILATGRVTYFDKILPLFSRKAKVGGDEVPLYGFSDGLARIGRSWGRWRAEQVFFLTSDHLPRTGTNAVDYVPYVWGERLAGIRAERIGDIWTLNARASTGRNSVEFDERIFHGNYLNNSYSRQSAAMELVRHAPSWEIMMGTSLDGRRNTYDWDYRELGEGPSPNSPLMYRSDDRQTLLALYGDFASDLPTGAALWRVHLGARAVSAGSASRGSPSFRLEYKPNSSINVALSAERRYQFQGILEEPGSLTIRPVEILLKEPRVADVAGFSVSVRNKLLPFSTRSSFRVEGFAKRYQNQVRPLGRSYGESDADYANQFPRLESVPGRAWGVLLFSALDFQSRARVQGSYTLQHVRQTYDGETAPTVWDIPQQLSVFANLDLTRKWRLDAVYEAHTGVPLTAVAARVLVPLANDAALPGFADGARNGLRAPTYQRLDMSAQRHWRTRSDREWTLGFHVLNALARANPVAIDWSRYYEALDIQSRGGSPIDPRITLVPSLPLLPSISLSVRW